MRIKSMRISNFRGYEDETKIEFEDLTAFVGKNDIGKSTILEALDIFFNDGSGVIKLDSNDINKECERLENKEICISVIFENLPPELIIDDSNPTDLKSEYLLNVDENLEIIKKYHNAGTAKVYIKALHPSHTECNNLHQKKDSELKKLLDKLEIDCEDKTRKACMRNAIWNFYKDELNVIEQELDFSKTEGKSIWEKIKLYLPVYSLFQADRKNTDGDNEVQDPLKIAVQQILNEVELQNKLAEIAKEVEEKLRDVSTRTLQKLHEMDRDIAQSLTPVIPAANKLKWQDVFKNVAISGDNDIPINKRGSGIKRLVLLNFFRAEAERRLHEQGRTSIIYAIEEPEVSQHTDNQRKLIQALLELSQAANTQIVITTHSATIVKLLHFDSIRLISIENLKKTISKIPPNQLPYSSVNEINFLAFCEITEEYHNELYGFIDGKKALPLFNSNQPTRHYIKLHNDGRTTNLNISHSEYIRHQIHHPENNNNVKYTYEELETSINAMRKFILDNAGFHP